MKNIKIECGAVGKRHKFNGAGKMLKFKDKVYRALKLILKGKVTTYKAIAEFIGSPGSARAVGNACSKNPNAPEVACHRVVKSNGSLGGYAGGEKKKIKLLRQEGVAVRSGKVEEFKKKKFRFK